MNETRRKPTTGRQSPSLCDKWHGIFYMPSRTDTAGHTKALDYPVTHTRLDIPRPLVTQSHRHGWTYQGPWLPSHTDTAGHTKAFDYPVTQTRLDIPRPLITQSHRHGWTYQGPWLPSRTDTAGHTKAFDYPVTQTRLDIPRPLVTQSHRHGWTYQGPWLPSHTDTAGHTRAFDYPVTQTRLDIPRPLITQSHRHGWTYQGPWLPSHTGTAGHTKAFIYLYSWGKVKVLRRRLSSLVIILYALCMYCVYLCIVTNNYTDPYIEREGTPSGEEMHKKVSIRPGARTIGGGAKGLLPPPPRKVPAFWSLLTPTVAGKGGGDPRINRLAGFRDISNPPLVLSSIPAVLFLLDVQKLCYCVEFNDKSMICYRRIV